MEKFILSITFIVWMIMTFILAISMVGWIVLVREDHNIQHYQGENGEAVWFKLGKSIIKKLTD